MLHKHNALLCFALPPTPLHTQPNVCRRPLAAVPAAAAAS
jgi:hypothetical protein